MDARGASNFKSCYYYPMGSPTHSLLRKCEVNKHLLSHACLGGNVGEDHFSFISR